MASMSPKAHEVEGSRQGHLQYGLLTPLHSNLHSHPGLDSNIMWGMSAAQSCLTLCEPMDYTWPGSSVHGILQARILEWVAIPFSRGSFQSRGRTWVSCTAGRLFTVWATREAPLVSWHLLNSPGSPEKLSTEDTSLCALENALSHAQGGDGFPLVGKPYLYILQCSCIGAVPSSPRVKWTWERWVNRSKSPFQNALTEWRALEGEQVCRLTLYGHLQGHQEQLLL